MKKTRLEICIEILLFTPAIIILGMEGAKFLVNVVMICILPWLGIYLYRNNPFRG